VIFIEGSAVQGTIQVLRKNSAHGNVLARVGYTYDVSGETYAGSVTLQGEEAATVGEEHRVLVAHDPRDPARHLAVFVEP
jgi:hypothetical protein